MIDPQGQWSNITRTGCTLASGKVDWALGRAAAPRQRPAPVHLNPDGFGYGSAGWLAGGGLSAVGSAFFRVPHGGGGQGAAGSKIQ